VWIGNTDAIYALGACLLYGDGLPANETRAVELLKQAAARDHPAAMCLLGECYDRGVESLPKDGSLGFYWIQRAADEGKLSKAEFLMGERYRIGDEDDELQSVQSSGGDYRDFKDTNPFVSSKIYHYNDMVDGDGGKKAEERRSERRRIAGRVKRDLAKSLEYYQRAADQGHPAALFRVGMAYEMGQSVPADMQRALQCYQQASEAGCCPEVWAQLGVWYTKGIFVERVCFAAQISSDTMRDSCSFYKRASIAGFAGGLEVFPTCSRCCSGYAQEAGAVFRGQT
jgi:hypothetical protein